MPEVGKVVYRISGDTSSFQSDVSKAEGIASKAGAAIGKAFLAAGAALATASTALATASVKAYAQTEQLVGGIETLYKQSADTVIENANRAFETAGMSANEYMETATGFAASLVQSLGGDTVKAADMADMAITDMADNANKMGTTITSIQYAYQGFAKQNYTMLDNLKLGYGGTKNEMERLLADASKLAGVEFKLGNYADMVQAIHVIQTELGITGTTAKEAAETISGSFSSAQGALENLIAGLANPDADLGRLVDDVEDTVETFLDNLVPAIEQTFESIREVFPELANEFTYLFRTLMPDALEDLLPIIGTVASAFLAYSAVTGVINKVTAALNGMTIAQAALNAVQNLNPIGLAVAGVVALTGAVVAATSALHKKSAEYEKLNTSVQNTVKAHEDAVEEIETETQDTLSLVGALERLADRTNKTAAEKQAMSQIVEQLNEEIPDLNLSYDELNDHLSMTAEQIRAVAEAQAEQEMYNENVEYLVDLYKQQAEAEQQIVELQGEMVRRQEELAEAGANYQYDGEYMRMAEELGALNDVYMTVQGQIDATSSAMEGMADTSTETTAVIQDGTQQFVGSISESLDNVRSTITSTFQDVNGTVQSSMGLFQEMSVEVDGTVQDLISSLDSQLAYMDEYSANLKKAVALGVDEGLIAKLSDGSVESAEILAQIVSGSESEIKELNEKFRQVEEGKTDFVETLTSMQFDFKNIMDEIIGEAKEGVDGMSLGPEAAQAARDTINGFINEIEGSYSSIASAMRGAASVAMSEFNAALDIHSPSHESMKSARYFTEGFTLGMEDSSQSMYDAVRAAAEGVVISFDEVLSRAQGAATSYNSTNQTIGDITVNVNGAEVSPESGQQLGEEVVYSLDQELRYKGAYL